MTPTIWERTVRLTIQELEAKLAEVEAREMKLREALTRARTLRLHNLPTGIDGESDDALLAILNTALAESPEPSPTPRMPEPTPRIVDTELYCAWIETHSGSGITPTVLYNGLKRPAVLGSMDRVHDANTGICLRIVYHNPDIENQKCTERFFAAVAEET
jgi:hypothetical protein